MKAFIKLGIITLLVFILQTNSSLAQKKGHHHHHANKKVVVVHKDGGKAYRHRRHVYHPHWGPNLAFHRRWVFFPRYNFYWDNRNNYYVYANNGVWINSPTPPPVVININLSNEKKYELDAPNDSINDVQKNNGTHIQSYPIND